jgi:hypothetical protein
MLGRHSCATPCILNVAHLDTYVKYYVPALAYSGHPGLFIAYRPLELLTG